MAMIDTDYGNEYVCLKKGFDLSEHMVNKWPLPDTTKLKITHHGDTRTIDKMLSDLNTNHASYWHWHTLLEKTNRMYNKARTTKDYGILLGTPLLIQNKTICNLECSMSQGAYDKVRLPIVVEMYKFLMEELE